MLDLVRHHGYKFGRRGRVQLKQRRTHTVLMTSTVYSQQVLGDTLLNCRYTNLLYNLVVLVSIDQLPYIDHELLIFTVALYA